MSRNVLIGAILVIVLIFVVLFMVGLREGPNDGVDVVPNTVESGANDTDESGDIGLV